MSQVLTERSGYRISIEKYEKMINANVLPEKHGLELLDGKLIPKGSSTPYELSVDKYFRLLDAGVIDENCRVELIHGQVVEKMPINPPHAAALAYLMWLLIRNVPESWTVRPESPVLLHANNSAPQPDCAIVRGPKSVYARRHPCPVDFGIVIEIADSTLHENRTTKLAMYAENLLPEYWIVNVSEQQIEVYTGPSGPGASPTYAERTIYLRNGRLPLNLDGELIATLEASDILPPE